MNHKVAGILLAGGQSSRMGRDKAMLDIGGKPVIQRVADTLLQCTPDVCLAAANEDDYRFLHLPVAADEYPGYGPLAGIYAGMKQIEADWYLVAACDMPFTSVDLMRNLLKMAIEAAGDGVGIPLGQAIIPSYGERMHPLYAVYHRTVLPSLREALEHKQLKVMEWVDEHNLVDVPLEGQLPRREGEFPESYDITPWCLYNMNDPEAYEQARRMYILKEMPGN
ncbi:molybdenum cofactor guanylyltransferase [Paenibacillus wenxiniae]|uniref:Probable molybdenum cofactor guanylyltransferase n=1 Tax=Paenibacillus wenxiniae TaxID=1636843 RepID=A0ABW4RMH9_9BACL